VAQALSAMGDDVSLLDETEASFRAAGGGPSTAPSTWASPTTWDSLRAAGIEEADIFLALTPSDNANLMAVATGGAGFGVPRAIARLDDPTREAAYRALAVDFVPTARLLARVLVERVHATGVRLPPGVRRRRRAGGGDGAGRRGGGHTVADLEIEGGLRVAAVQRQGQRPHPRSSDPSSRGDLVAAAARRGVAHRVRRYLAVEDGGES